MAGESAAQELAQKALDEAQATVRAYDTKAQIVGIGYIFALGVVARIEARFADIDAIGLPYVVVSWIVLVLPAVLFGFVLYPSRRLLRCQGIRGVLYVRPSEFAGPDAYAAALREANPIQEIASELLKVSELREIKRRRFLRALFVAGGALAALLGFHLLRVIA